MSVTESLSAPAATASSATFVMKRPDTRLPFEHRVYTVIAAVVLIRPEEDSDLHVVLQQGGNQ